MKRYSIRAVATLALFVPGCLGFGDLMGGSTDDAGSIVDASMTGDTNTSTPDAEALVDGEADAAHFCAGYETAILCADFDESDAALYGFTGAQITDGGFIGVDDLVFASPPGSLHTGSAALASGTSSEGDVARDTAVTPTNGLTMDFDVMADALPSTGSSIEAIALVFASSTRSSLQFNLTQNIADLGEEIVKLDGGKTFLAHDLAHPIPIGTWTHVTVEVVFSSPSTVSVAVNGLPSVPSAQLQPGFVVGPLTINLGNSYCPGPSTATSVHFDNFVVVSK